MKSDNHMLNPLLKPAVSGEKEQKENNLHTFVAARPSELAPLNQTARQVNEEYLGALVHFE